MKDLHELGRCGYDCDIAVSACAVDAHPTRGRRRDKMRSPRCWLHRGLLLHRGCTNQDRILPRLGSRNEITARSCLSLRHKPSDHLQAPTGRPSGGHSRVTERATRTARSCHWACNVTNGRRTRRSVHRTCQGVLPQAGRNTDGAMSAFRLSCRWPRHCSTSATL